MQLDAGDHIVLDRQKRDGSVIFVVHGPAAAALPAAPLLELLSVRDADSLVGSDVTSGVKLVLLVEHAADAAHDVAYVWFAWDTLIKYERAAGTEPLRQLAARLTPGGRFYEAAAKTEWVDKQRVDEGLKPWRNVCEWKCNPPHTWQSFSQDAQRLASAAACGPRELRGALEALAPPSSDHLPPAREGSGGKRRRNEPPSAPGPSADDDGGRALCPPWELPLGESRWYLTARHLHGGTVSYGGRNITPNEHSKPCSLAAFTPEYVPADLASTLTRLLDGVDVVPFDDSARFDDSVQAPATVPNAFGGMRPPSSPSRLAFAEAEGLTYRYGRVRYAQLCRLLRRLAAQLSERELKGRPHRYAGRDTCLSWHRDRAEAQGSSDAGQVYDTPVASISLGASRVFAFCPDAYKDKQPQYGLRLSHGSLLVMTAECNREYAHALLQGSTADGEGARYNLTFRCMQGGPPGV
ncbi:hypothetical protein EMIHUDRAFT_225460 [Emiliania huxleyi CCMP1516]|uniref:Fe2OG dioxygenase domain-containing protein n=2 Tax=Emiliania huxleyi TaxID=2903 RepID=A0A0D3KP76_EMIH1|nr:hypothetical protein EMIHUDRAFT_225460 [Emiliania huxleyi CCMP1516]EOD37561.1 hypothetical protein EMIHUDRAFT_225460 [Emiliania huxleyi CCMP1516]|eukprot:XP_005789990.1 hypothetical protein EMIHUDRAFT_225460 [Emiliania huxleyi CCMP1516]